MRRPATLSPANLFRAKVDAELAQAFPRGAGNGARPPDPRPHHNHHGLAPESIQRNEAGDIGIPPLSPALRGFLRADR